MSLHRNRVQMTVTGTPGTGTITLNAATTGYQSFSSAYGADATVDILITEGNNWEVCRNCAYTNSTPQVGRGTLEGSSAGPTTRVSFGSGAIVSVIATAGFGNDIESTFQSLTPGGRLTLESGVPVSTTDQTSKTTIYYTPYVHNVISLWNGSNWVPTRFTETSLALGTLTSGANYDVFGFLSSGALALEMLVWTNNTARATAVTLQDGRYCKSGDKTRLYLGTFRTTSTTTTEDSGFVSTTAARKRFVWNAYNRVKRVVMIEEDTASWTWTGVGSTWRQWRGASGTDNQIEVVVGLDREAAISLVASATHANATISRSSAIAIGFDSITAIAEYCVSFFAESVRASATAPIPVNATLSQQVPLGYHYWAALEENTDGTSTLTAYGTNTLYRRTGMVGWVEA